LGGDGREWEMDWGQKVRTLAGLLSGFVVVGCSGNMSLVLVDL
jgi:hypothetical protein